MRVGFGVDVHRFGGDGPVWLGGIPIDSPRGVEATSDGDVALHALADALLGAAALGDLGTHFPSSDSRWEDAASSELLTAVTAMVRNAGFAIRSVDVTVIVQAIRVEPHRAAMRAAIAGSLGLETDAVSVKATTTDGLGVLGRGEGIAATAVAVLDQAG